MVERVERSIAFSVLKVQNVVFLKNSFFFEGAKCRLKAVFKKSNVYKALLILLLVGRIYSVLNLVLNSTK